MRSLRDALESGQTLVFGHRGASADAPMNTLAAFELAADQGADGIELDVQRSADGVLVIAHDFEIDGLGRVDEQTYDALKAHDPDLTTLDEVLQAVRGRLFVNVEIKSKGFRTDGVEALVAETIQRHEMTEHVLVSSFNPIAIRRFGRKAPGVLLGYLDAPDIPVYVNWLAIGMRYDVHHPHEAMIDTRYQRHAPFVAAWTVNEASRAWTLRDLEVNIIITDKPRTIRDALAGG